MTDINKSYEATPDGTTLRTQSTSAGIQLMPHLSTQAALEIASSQATQDLLSVEEVLAKSIRSKLAAPKELANRLILSGGKRLRPYLLCLIYRALRALPEFDTRTERGSEADLHHLGAVSELVHTATLFHDDVLDHSETRRGLSAAHIDHGNKTAVLVGDFVYAEAFYVLMERGLLTPSHDLAHTVKTIVEGELLQHLVTQNRSLDIVEYDQIAHAKTGTLFGWCTGTGAWLAGSAHFIAARDFGRTLGYAFQLADDLIDTFEIDAHSASDSDLISWLSSAPPLPLVIAANNTPTSLELKQQWKSAPELISRDSQIACVLQLQEAARADTVVKQSLKRVDDALNVARQLLEQFGLGEQMSWAIESIAERAQQGAALAKANPAQRRTHELL